MEKTIRQMVITIQNEIAKGDLMPNRTAELLTELANISGKISEHILEMDVKFNEVLLWHLENEKKASFAKIKAETTAEYRAKREARNTGTLVEELIRSLKYLLRSYENEFRNGKLQP